MKVLKIILISLVLCSVSALSISCASESDSESESQIATVQRGDLTVDIAAVGNLAFCHTEELVLGIPATVEEVLVAEGESVEEGQVLVKLDASEWDKELTTLEINYVQAEIDLEDAELALEKAEDPYTREEINAAEDLVDAAEYDLEYARWQLSQAYESGDEELIWKWRLEVLNAQTNLSSAEEKLEDMRDAPDPLEIDMKKLQVKLAEWRLEDAQKALEEALDTGPEITAPFDGFITKVNISDGDKVNISDGDEVGKGTVAMVIADPTKFEAELTVSEMDIFQIKLGGEAWVQVDTMQGMSLPAKVTYISPTATIQQGVVSYKVKVEMDSLEAVMQQQQQARQEAMEEMAEGELPERIRQAIEEGLITQEQAEEMMKQMQQGQWEQQGQMPAMIPEDFQLREGLTVTVSIIIEERNNVLLVPNGAITTRGRQTSVQVMLPDGTTEERVITTGISNWQYTEVTEGLSEGEQVIVPQSTATTTTSQQGPREEFFIGPGMGGPPSR
jgi:HlyD family secretion protein